MRPRQGPRVTVPDALSVAALASGILFGHAAVAANTGRSSATRTPLMRIAAVSTFCQNLGSTVMDGVEPDLRARSVAASAGCLYSTTSGDVLLSLAPTSRSAAPAAPDPAPVDTDIRPVSGLGDAAFSENDVIADGGQTVTVVVWRSATQTWALTLSELGSPRDLTAELVEVARVVAPMLPG